MGTQSAIDELLDSACPAIRYRMRRDILEGVGSYDGLRDLQEHVLGDSQVHSLFVRQSPDGWLGQPFHRYDSHEAAVRLLAEKGVPPDHPPLAAALCAIEDQGGRIEGELGRVGRVLDERGFGGTCMMRAATLAHAGLENNDLVREQVQAALEGFRAVLEVESVEAMTERYRGKRVFRHGVRWPGIYHLRLLAYTHSWRGADHCTLLTQAVARLVALSPIPPILVRERSQRIAPAWFAMQDSGPDMAAMDAPQWMMWFHRRELLARLGLIWGIPGLARQGSRLAKMLESPSGWFALRLRHEYFARWGAYTGLMLEHDWKSPWRRQYDPTFRSLLILHNSSG